MDKILDRPASIKRLEDRQRAIRWIDEMDEGAAMHASEIETVINALNDQNTTDSDVLSIAHANCLLGDLVKISHRPKVPFRESAVVIRLQDKEGRGDIVIERVDPTRGFQLWIEMSDIGGHFWEDCGTYPSLEHAMRCLSQCIESNCDHSFYV